MAARARWNAVFVSLFVFAASVRPASAQTPAAAGTQPPEPSAAQIAEACGGDGPTMAAPRWTPIPPEKWTEEQKQVAEEFMKIRGSNSRARGVFGPYAALLRSPEVLLHSVRLGSYLQFRSVLSAKLEQFAIIVTARQWTMQYMWNVHCRQALREGVSAATIQALLQGRRPTGMAADETILFDVYDELQRNQGLTDDTYNRAMATFGEQGMVDLIGLNAYYTFLAMLGNAVRMPVGEGTKPNLPAFPR